MPSIKTEKELTQTIRTETIEKLSQLLKEAYVNAEKGNEVSIQINKNLLNGKYDNIKDLRQFSEILTTDLFTLSNDKHLEIYYSPEQVAIFKNSMNLPEPERKAYLDKELLFGKNQDFGFQKLEIFPGNIGYLRINTFMDTQWAGETAAAAMQFLSTTDAIIMDLRRNDGGWPSMVQLLGSFFFDNNDNITLFEEHIPSENTIIQYRTLPYLPGKRMAKTPLYILVGENTWSAAECLAYSLQKLKRATIVGEKTNYGAHSTRGPKMLNDYYVVKMPIGKMVSPITQSNWEGIGVEPDIKIGVDDALDTVVLEILSKKMEQNSDENAISELGWLCLKSEKIDLAVFVFQENIKRHPDSAECFNNLGKAYLYSGEKQLAVELFEKSLTINPINKSIENIVKQTKISMN